MMFASLDHQNAHVFKTGESYTGVHAYMNLWEPAVEANGQSNARIWLMATDQSDDVDIISAGWMVGKHNIPAPGRLFVDYRSYHIV